VPSHRSSDGDVDVDLAALAAAFGRRLREIGLPVTHERSARFVRAVALAEPRNRGELYWTARAVFVSSEAQLPAFDRVFAAVFDPALEPEEERGDPYSPPLEGDAAQRPPPPGARPVPRAGEADERAGLRPSAAPGDGGSEGREIEVPLALASEDERLAEKSFAALTPDELARLRRMMSELELATPQRRKRRVRRARRGERLDLRRTLRASMRSGGDTDRCLAPAIRDSATARFASRRALARMPKGLAPPTIWFGRGRWTRLPRRFHPHAPDRQGGAQPH